MKKGFTLIELLVVIVIVGILVTVALPKYRTAMEKGRGLEAVANAGALSDALNVYYVRNYNSYAQSSNSAKSAAAFAAQTGQQTTNKFFTYTVSSSTSTPTVTLSRAGLGAKAYNIVFVNSNGEVSERYCTGYKRYCQALGAVTPRAGGGWYL